jgi:hypothetical protein
MWHKARAQPNQSGARRTAKVWRIFENCFIHLSRKVGGVGR